LIGGNKGGVLGAVPVAALGAEGAEFAKPVGGAEVVRPGDAGDFEPARWLIFGGFEAKGEPVADFEFVGLGQFFADDDGDNRLLGFGLRENGLGPTAGDKFDVLSNVVSGRSA